MAEEQKTEMAPDPDEDDLSDLDDMLDEFSATKLEDKKTTGTSAVAGLPAQGSKAAADNDEEDFERQLQDGMAQLLGQFGSNPEMQTEIETMMRELNNAAAKGNTEEALSSSKPNTTSKPNSANRAKSGDDAFQDTIRRTMERMQNSGESASAAAASSNEEDMLAQMLKEMENGNFPGLDGGSEEDFNKMLMGMMEQLTNKEILYEPMKDLQEKFPDWLEKNKDKTKADDLKRYEEQQRIVGDICARFERNGYSDENKEDRDYIVARMQEMQAAGSPPPDLVGDLGSAEGMLGDMGDTGCPQQ
ncbi:peroxin [Myriangium duriaei CBS 260.36]|uniref:Peroxin n=1 Tax=Myriangium duriaei CBS 260.36 TaxID=1168546 RepID=A0A9P4J7M1_9PEZI|nr:peroxin [Myriangium duriaei CBS 260.36]